MANPATRICFRVGDEDAKRLADSFQSFTAQDLQNLGTGEALCRMERFDFNLRTAPLPPVQPNAYVRDSIYRQSRQKYASARSTVEEELAQSRIVIEPEPAKPVDPFAKRKADAEAKAKPEEPQPAKADVTPAMPPPVAPKAPPDAEMPKQPKPPPEPTTPGKGGPQHRRLQETFKLLAEKLGWRASIEEAVPGGSVDVAFGKGAVTVACEISVTTPVDYELGNLRKCLAASFTHVVMVSEEPKHLAKIEAAAKETFTTAEMNKIRFLEPDGLLVLLEELTAAQAGGEKTVKGYRVSTSYKTLSEAEKRNRKEGIGGAVARAMRRSKEGGKP